MLRSSVWNPTRDDYNSGYTDRSQSDHNNDCLVPSAFDDGEGCVRPCLIAVTLDVETSGQVTNNSCVFPCGHDHNRGYIDHCAQDESVR